MEDDRFSPWQAGIKQTFAARCESVYLAVSEAASLSAIFFHHKPKFPSASYGTGGKSKAEYLGTLSNISCKQPCYPGAKDSLEVSYFYWLKAALQIKHCLQSPG